MKAVDLLRALQGYDALLSTCGISPKLINRLDVYERIKLMMDAGEKKTYIFARVGEDVGLHPRQVRRIWKTLNKEI